MGSSQSTSKHEQAPSQYQHQPSAQQYQQASHAQRTLQHSTTTRFRAIADRFTSVEAVQEELRRAGLEASQLIVAIDFTKSNEWTGKHSFGGKSLHHVSAQQLNPYEEAISAIGRTLASFDDDQLIPAYGFGDASTGDRRVFSFLPDDKPCHGLEHVLAAYRQTAMGVRLSGPTSFAPAIRQAMRVVAESGGQYHILLLIADGQVTRSSDLPDHVLSAQEQETVNAIVEASSYPLSIILVGVGDGPWDTARKYDDYDYAGRRFDNLQFVNYTQLCSQYSASPAHKEAMFALRALMEVPEQYKEIQKLGLLGRVPTNMPTTAPAPPPVATAMPQPMQQQQWQQQHQQQWQQPGANPGMPPQQQWQQQPYGASNGPQPQFNQSSSFAGAAGAPMYGATQYPSCVGGAPGGPGLGAMPQYGSFGAGMAPPGIFIGQQPGSMPVQQPSAPSAPAASSDPAANSMFICPITQDVMADPVIAADGYTYDRAAITEWLSKKGTSPMTNQPMRSKDLTPNHNLRSAIMEAKERHRQ